MADGVFRPTNNLDGVDGQLAEIVHNLIVPWEFSTNLGDEEEEEEGLPSDGEVTDSASTPLGQDPPPTGGRIATSLRMYVYPVVNRPKYDRRFCMIVWGLNRTSQSPTRPCFHFLPMPFILIRFIASGLFVVYLTLIGLVYTCAPPSAHSRYELSILRFDSICD